MNIHTVAAPMIPYKKLKNRCALNGYENKTIANNLFSGEQLKKRMALLKTWLKIPDREHSKQHGH